MGRRSVKGQLVTQHLEMVSSEHLHELESLALRIAKPKGNVQKGKFIRSENLEREIRRRFRDEQEAELRELFSRSHRKAKLPSEENQIGAGTLSRHIDGPMKIRFRYKGKVYRGRILKNGHISLRGKKYSSPSSASSSIAKRPTDGWYCWRFERGPGDWVVLNTLRQ